MPTRLRTPAGKRAVLWLNGEYRTCRDYETRLMRTFDDLP